MGGGSEKCNVLFKLNLGTYKNIALHSKNPTLAAGSTRQLRLLKKWELIVSYWGKIETF